MAIKETKGGASAQLRFGGGRRQAFPIVGATDATDAERRAAVMRELAKLLVDSGRLLEAPAALQALGQAAEAFDETASELRKLCDEPLPPRQTGLRGMTFRQFGEEWTSGRLAAKFKNRGGKVRPKKSAKDDAQRLAVLCRTVGDVPIATFGKADAHRAMDALPETVQSDSTRRQYAQIVSRLLHIAVYPCELRDDYPLPKEFRPDPAPQPEFQLLYPSEDAKLCASEKLDVRERALYGFAVRVGLRLANLLDLTWGNYDAEQRQLWVPDTKTAKPLQFTLDLGCCRALDALRKLGPTKPSTAAIFPQLDRTTISKRLRAALQVAGVDRAQLFTESPHQFPVRFHDLRASFITFALANGRTEAWITERTGHTSSQMIHRYQRDRVKQLARPDWLPLDVALGLSVDGAATAGEHPEHAQTEQEPEHGLHGSRLPAALAEQPRAQLVDGGDGSGRAPLPVAGAAALLGAERSDEVAAAGAEGNLDALDEQVVAERALDGDRPGLGLDDHGASLSGHFGPEWVATRVATGFFGVSVPWEFPVMNSGPYVVGRGGFEPPTYGLKVLHNAPAIARDAARDEPAPGRADMTSHETPSTLPRSSLSDDILEELCEIATAAKRWRCVAALATDLAAIEQSRATRSNVTPLLVERRRKA